MWKELIDFLSLADPNIRYVVLGSMVITASSAVVGSFTFLKKRALVGDAVAHSVLPGVCLAFLFTGSKDPIFLVPGALLTGWVSVVVIDKIVARSKIKEDTAIGIALSVFFGLGILLLTYIQSSGSAAQSGLDHFLFGKAASIVRGDLITFSIISLMMMLAIVLFYKEFSLIAFDLSFAKSIGLPVGRYELLLTSLTVLAVVVGIQAVGVVLMAAMLITPAAAARYWTDDLKKMMVLSAIFGSFSGLAGAYISYIAPAMPTGPWIVVVISTIAFFSIFFAPGKGVVSLRWHRRRLSRKVLEENILKTMYQIGEGRQDFFETIQANTMSTQRQYDVHKLRKGLKRLIRYGYIVRQPQGYQFTQAGKIKGERVVRLHRLWELYLTQYLRIAPDHVHEDAESIEHIITPEIESRLQQALGHPQEDPHRSGIPYS
jgi:manganese/zinc/iron transport system permease protein